jgi:hypothetical protein
MENSWSKISERDLGSKPEESLEKKREGLVHWQIWGNYFRDELTALRAGMEAGQTPKESMRLGDGYQQFSRILGDIYQGRVGTMGEDIARDIDAVAGKQVAPHNFFGFIPYQLLAKIDGLLKDDLNKGDISKEDVDVAISQIAGFIAELDRVLI